MTWTMTRKKKNLRTSLPNSIIVDLRTFRGIRVVIFIYLYEGQLTIQSGTTF